MKLPRITPSIAVPLLAIFSMAYLHPAYAESEGMSAADLLAPGLVQQADEEASAPPAAPAGSAPAPAAKKAPPPPKPVTIQDLTIPTDELGLLVKPLSTDELKVEADAWFKAVQKQSKKVTEVEVETTQLNKKQMAVSDQLSSIEAILKPTGEIEKDAEGNVLTPELRLEQAKAALLGLDSQAASVDPADAMQAAFAGLNEKLDAEKEVLTEKSSKLRETRTQLVDRFNTVLDAINVKAGVKEDGTDNDIVVPYRRYVSTVASLNVDLKDTDSMIKVGKKWLFSKEGGMRWAKNIALFLGILIGFWFLSKILGFLVSRALKAAGNTSVLLHEFLVGIVKKLTLLFGVLAGLSALEVNISPLLAALGAAGFILAFALQGTISNFASGLLMMLYRPFDVGDSIEAAGVSGDVESMSLVSTHIKTGDNQRLVIPNNAVWSGNIANASNTSTRRVDLSFMVDHGDNADAVMGLLDGVVKRHPLVLRDPAPTVKLDEIADGGMKFVVQPWVKTADYDAVKWDITREVKRCFDNKELTMPIPPAA